MCFLLAVWCNLICSWSFRSNSTVPFLQTCGPWFARNRATKWIMLCVEFFRALICSWQLSFIASWQIQKLGFPENDSLVDGLGYQPKASILDETGRSPFEKDGAHLWIVNEIMWKSCMWMGSGGPQHNVFIWRAGHYIRLTTNVQFKDKVDLSEVVVAPFHCCIQLKCLSINSNINTHLNGMFYQSNGY